MFYQEPLIKYISCYKFHPVLTGTHGDMQARTHACMRIMGSNLPQISSPLVDLVDSVSWTQLLRRQ